MARKKLGLEQRVAARIKSLREELSLSQADLARLAGTSRSYVSEVACALRPPRSPPGRAPGQLLRRWPVGPRCA